MALKTLDFIENAYTYIRLGLLTFSKKQNVVYTQQKS